MAFKAKAAAAIAYVKRKKVLSKENCEKLKIKLSYSENCLKLRKKLSECDWKQNLNLRNNVPSLKKRRK